jgi:hypothetical protein
MIYEARQDLNIPIKLIIQAFQKSNNIFSARDALHESSSFSPAIRRNIDIIDQQLFQLKGVARLQNVQKLFEIGFWYALF